ncbi:MAG: small, acid-soluble spore protein, H family [Peptococcaceae bacterium]
MDFQRAQEILNSPENIQVLHKDKSIWITDLNEREKTAEVAAGPQFKTKMTVSLADLEEIHNKH